MKLLVVGASGFIGRNLLRRLRDWNEVVGTYHAHDDFPRFLRESRVNNVSAHRCDLTDEEQVKSLFREQGDFNACVYLASDTRVGYLSSDPSADVINNILSMANFAKHYRGDSVIFFSSGAVYMGQKGRVSHASVEPTIPYAISKLSAELYLKHQSHLSSFASIIVRFFGAYGPGEPERKITRKLLLAVDAAKSKEFEFTVYGDGKNLIDVMYVEDAVRAINLMLNFRKKSATVDLCGEAAMPVNDYVRNVVSVLGRSVRIKHEGGSPEYIRFHSSNYAFRRTFGDFETTPLDKGIHRYMTWLREVGAARAN